MPRRVLLQTASQLHQSKIRVRHRASRAAAASVLMHSSRWPVLLMLPAVRRRRRRQRSQLEARLRQLLSWWGQRWHLPCRLCRQVQQLVCRRRQSQRCHQLCSCQRLSRTLWLQLLFCQQVAAAAGDLIDDVQALLDSLSAEEAAVDQLIGQPLLSTLIPQQPVHIPKELVDQLEDTYQGGLVLKLAGGDTAGVAVMTTLSNPAVNQRDYQGFLDLEAGVILYRLYVDGPVIEHTQNGAAIPADGFIVGQQQAPVSNISSITAATRTKQTKYDEAAAAFHALQSAVVWYLKERTATGLGLAGVPAAEAETVVIIRAGRVVDGKLLAVEPAVSGVVHHYPDDVGCLPSIALRSQWSGMLCARECTMAAVAAEILLAAAELTASGWPFTCFAELTTARFSNVIGIRSAPGGGFYGTLLDGKYVQNDVR